MNIDENFDQNNERENYERGGASPMPKRIAVIIGSVCFTYLIGYFLFFKILGESDTWTEYYFENEVFLYAEELTVTDFSWSLPDPLAQLLYVIYHPAMVADGKRVDVQADEQERVTRLFIKYLGKQVRPDVIYYATLGDEGIYAAEHTLFIAGMSYDVEFDADDNSKLEEVDEPINPSSDL